MRRTKSFYKADAEFDIIQKTKNNKTNLRKISEIDNSENQVNTSQANSYLSGLVNEMKETMLNFDDNIFNEIKQPKQKKNPDNYLSLNYMGVNKLKKVTTLNRSTTLLSNRSGRSTKSRKTNGSKSNRANTRHFSNKSIKNGANSSRSVKGNLKNVNSDNKSKFLTKEIKIKSTKRQFIFYWF